MPLLEWFLNQHITKFFGFDSDVNHSVIISCGYFFFSCCCKPFSFSHSLSCLGSWFLSDVPSISTWVAWCLSTTEWMVIPSQSTGFFTIDVLMFQACLGLLLDHLFCVSLYSWAILAIPLCTYMCHHLGRKAIALILHYQHFFTIGQPACQAFILKENLVVVLIGVALSQSLPPPQYWGKHT